MKVYLDDYRKIPDDTWTLATSYQNFRHVIEDGDEEITEISFDHDLGVDSSNHVALTGMDAVKWLISHIECFAPELNRSLKAIYVHSANPVGAENIRSYCKSAQKHGILNMDVVVK